MYWNIKVEGSNLLSPSNQSFGTFRWANSWSTADKSKVKLNKTWMKIKKHINFRLLEVTDCAVVLFFNSLTFWCPSGIFSDEGEVAFCVFQRHAHGSSQKEPSADHVCDPLSWRSRGGVIPGIEPIPPDCSGCKVRRLHTAPLHLRAKDKSSGLEVIANLNFQN